MTNKTINGVPRDLIQEAYNELTCWKSPVAGRLRALLAAPTNELREHCKKCAEEVSAWPAWKRDCLGAAPDPIVEADGIGEPVAWIEIDEDALTGKTIDWYQEDLREIPLHTKLHSADQLAALQSTIAQLKADNERLRGEHGDPCTWTDRQILDFIGVALRNVDPLGSVVLNEIRQGFKYMRDQSACLDEVRRMNP